MDPHLHFGVGDVDDDAILPDINSSIGFEFHFDPLDTDPGSMMDLGGQYMSPPNSDMGGDFFASDIDPSVSDSEDVGMGLDSMEGMPMDTTATPDQQHRVLQTTQPFPGSAHSFPPSPSGVPWPPSALGSGASLAAHDGANAEAVPHPSVRASGAVGRAAVHYSAIAAGAEDQQATGAQGRSGRTRGRPAGANGTGARGGRTGRGRGRGAGRGAQVKVEETDGGLVGGEGVYQGALGALGGLGGQGRGVGSGPAVRKAESFPRNGSDAGYGAGNFGAPLKRHAPYGQWQTPPSVHYNANSHVGEQVGAVGSVGGLGGVGPGMRKALSTPDFSSLMAMTPPPQSIFGDQYAEPEAAAAMMAARAAEFATGAVAQTSLSVAQSRSAKVTFASSPNLQAYQGLGFGQIPTAGLGLGAAAGPPQGTQVKTESGAGAFRGQAPGPSSSPVPGLTPNVSWPDLNKMNFQQPAAFPGRGVGAGAGASGAATTDTVTPPLGTLPANSKNGVDTAGIVSSMPLRGVSLPSGLHNLAVGSPAAALSASKGGDQDMDQGTMLRAIMSCPDVLTFYQRIQTEDERRRKRLARNRASARQRRLRKKTMVESYEQEVQQLETAIKELQEHDWGRGQSAALISGLEMPLGAERAPVLPTSSTAERHQMAATLVDQLQNLLGSAQAQQLEGLALPRLCHYLNHEDAASVLSTSSRAASVPVQALSGGSGSSAPPASSAAATGGAGGPGGGISVGSVNTGANNTTVATPMAVAMAVDGGAGGSAGLGGGGGGSGGGFGARESSGGGSGGFGWYARRSRQTRQASDPGNTGMTDDSPQSLDHRARLGKDLMDRLQLTPQQCSQLNHSLRNLDEELLEIAIMEKCMEALKLKLCTDYPTMDGVAEAWKTMLNATQLGKYTNWIELNRDTFRHLDLLRPQGSAGPEFLFGADDAAAGSGGS